MTFQDISDKIQALSATEIAYICIAVLVVLAFLLYLIRRQPKKVVAYSTDNGRVMVSRQAIVELVRTSCEQLQDVSRPQVKINVKGSTTHFEIRIKLLSGGRLRNIEKTLQSHLRKALTDNLGIENLGRINIIATGFKSGRIDSNLPTKSPASPIVESTGDYMESDDSDFEATGIK